MGKEAALPQVAASLQAARRTGGCLNDWSIHHAIARRPIWKMEQLVEWLQTARPGTQLPRGDIIAVVGN